MLTTSTRHGWTASIPLHPMLALGTLLKLGSLRKFNEGLVVLIETIIDSIFLAGHAYVVVASTSQTVVLLAGRTPVVVESLIELKDCLAACSGTPGGAGIILLHELVEGDFFKFFSELSIYIAEDLIGIQHMLASLHGT